MITVRDIAYGLFGAWRLAKLDPSGIRYFGDSMVDFWRSFFAAVLAAPAFAILIMLRLSDMPIQSGPWRIFLVEAIAYVIGWVLFPLVMVRIVQMIDKERNFVRYIVAYNWAVVLQITLSFIVAGIVTLDLMPSTLTQVLSALTDIAILIYQWFIARIALEIGGVGAAFIVVIDLIISVLLTGVTFSML